MASMLQYGRELPDQANSLLHHLSSVVSSYSDLEKFVDERAQLEREYAAKLGALTKKAVERKAKRGEAVWVGENAARSGSAATISINRALDSLLANADTTASYHASFADQLASQVAVVLHERERHKEAIRGRYAAYYATMIEQRDGFYADRIKAQSKYQSACTDLEAARQKHQSLVASSDKHADRALKSFQAAQSTVAECKNALLLEIEISNAVKEKTYRVDLPDFEDRLETFHYAALGALHSVIRSAVDLQATHLDKLRASVEQTAQTVAAVDLAKDIEVFVAGNRRVGAWSEPDGWSWEPAEGFYEVGTWATEGSAKVVLQNRLANAGAKLDQISPILEIKEKELESLTSLLTTASLPSPGMTTGDPDSVADSLQPLLPEVLGLASQATAANIVLARLADALGDETGEGRAHDFKSASFTVPTKCRVCEGSIWGLTKQGKSCRNCGVVVHSKCELKIPGNCARASGSASVTRRPSTASTVSRAPSTASGGSSRAPPSLPGSSGLAGGTGAVEEEESDDDDNEGGRQVSVMFDYGQTSDFELTVSEGETVLVVEEDDGSGWVKVANMSGARGLVPATYLSASADAPASAPAASTVPAGGDEYVTALYDYTAQGPDELSLVEGESIALTAVGRAYGEGWWEGTKGGVTGIFPSNYCQQ